jgi:hypothetical protein
MIHPSITQARSQEIGRLESPLEAAGNRALTITSPEKGIVHQRLKARASPLATGRGLARAFNGRHLLRALAKATQVQTGPIILEKH